MAAQTVKVIAKTETEILALYSQLEVVTSGTTNVLTVLVNVGGNPVPIDVFKNTELFPEIEAQIVDLERTRRKEYLDELNKKYPPTPEGVAGISPPVLRKPYVW